MGYIVDIACVLIFSHIGFLYNFSFSKSCCYISMISGSFMMMMMKICGLSSSHMRPSLSMCIAVFSVSFGEQEFGNWPMSVLWRVGLFSQMVLLAQGEHLLSITSGALLTMSLITSNIKVPMATMSIEFSQIWPYLACLEQGKLMSRCSFISVRFWFWRNIEDGWR